METSISSIHYFYTRPDPNLHRYFHMPLLSYRVLFRYVLLTEGLKQAKWATSAPIAVHLKFIKPILSFLQDLLNGLLFKTGVCLDTEGRRLQIRCPD